MLLPDGFLLAGGAGGVTPYLQGLTVILICMVLYGLHRISSKKNS